MSDLLHRTRLRWSHGRGLAAHDGVSVELHAPALPVLQHVERLVEVEYSPGLGIAYLQTAVDARRDMGEQEMAEVMGWLERVAGAARRVAASG